MALFDIPTRSDHASDSAILQKMKQKKLAPTVVKGGGGISEKIATIKAMVEKHLGKFKDEYIVIQDENILHDYITKSIENGVISIDTETTGLDPLQDDLVGICIYTPDMKAAYIPVGHISYVTGQKSKNQLSLEFCGKEFSRLIDIKENIMFNACFDLRFLKNHIGVDLICTWDAYLASRLLNENEPSKGLKALHKKYILRGEEDAFKFDDLFKGMNFAYVPIQTAYLYAAHDAIITYEYYMYQKQYLRLDSERQDMRDIAWVFHNIEMPCVKVVAGMEDTGVAFDLDYAAQLKDKYSILLEERKEDVYKMIDMYKDDIDKYCTNNSNNKLSNPINIDSPVQLAILLYDIIGVKSVDKKSPRGTGEDILKKLDMPLCNAILEYRAIGKLMNTYVEKLPDCVNPKDGRIHCKFNQYGADTGRMSSTDPNLQNIPSHNKDIRKMFKATDGYVLMSSDYSQQEPRLMALLCNDPKMINAYREDKDLYAEIAALSFNTTYDNCLEFRPDGTTNPDGKNRRSQAKSILLGVLYGRGVPSIAEQLGTTTKKAQAIKDSVFKGFPAIEQFEKDSIQMAEDLGYVTTLWGRKRRLPDMQLPDYEFVWKDGAKPSDDPLNFDDEEVETEVPDELVRKYVRKLNNAWGSKRQEIYEEANAEGIWIIDNTKKRADAQRQCVNARIQGSASDLTKLALITVGNDARLKELGFRMLIPIHDEILAECPEENAKECAERFTHLMNIAGGDRFTIPIHCDAEITKVWYGEKIEI